MTSAFRDGVTITLTVEEATRLADGIHYLSTTPGARPGDQDPCERIESARRSTSVLGGDEQFWKELAHHAFPDRGWGLAVDEDVRAVIRALDGFDYRIVKLRETHAADFRMGAEYVIEDEL